MITIDTEKTPFVTQDILIDTQDAFVVVPAFVSGDYAFHLTHNADGTFGPHYSIVQLATGRMIATDLFTARFCRQVIELAQGVRIAVCV